MSNKLRRLNAKLRRRVANGTVPSAYTTNSGEENATSEAAGAPKTGADGEACDTRIGQAGKHEADAQCDRLPRLEMLSGYDGR